MTTIPICSNCETPLDDYEYNNHRCMADEMSCLEDMIDDACSNRNDDEVLLYHLSLKSQILEALDKSSNGKDLAEEPKSPMIVEATKHDGSMVLEKYYKEKNYDTKQH